MGFGVPADPSTGTPGLMLTPGHQLGLTSRTPQTHWRFGQAFMHSVSMHPQKKPAPPAHERLARGDPVLRQVPRANRLATAFTQNQAQTAWWSESFSRDLAGEVRDRHHINQFVPGELAS